MIVGLLDPYVLACPHEPTEAELTELIGAIIKWRDLDQWYCVDTFISEQTVECLTNAGCGFPPWQGVKEAVVRLNLGIATQDVFSLISGLLDRLPKIEEALGIHEILIDSVEYHPDITAERSPVFIDGFERLLALGCLLSEQHPQGVEHGVAVLTRNLVVCPSMVNYSAQLHDVSPPTNEPLPKRLEISARAFGCSKQFIGQIDPADVWCDSEADIGLFEAIRLLTMRTALAEGINNPTPWTLGRQFGATVDGLHLKTKAMARSILRACVETILDQNLASVHAIRVDRGANSAQLRQRGYLAVRRDIDHEFHLHYWNSPQHKVLASIVTHNDYSIPNV